MARNTETKTMDEDSIRDCDLCGESSIAGAACIFCLCKANGAHPSIVYMGYMILSRKTQLDLWEKAEKGRAKK
jgi:hypothetical protein